MLLRARFATVALALTALCVSVPGRASLTRQMDAPELAAEAGVIAIGTVVGIRPCAGYHEVDLRVEVPLKRSHPDEVLTLTLPGGADPGSPDYVSHVPHFGAGETALVYVRQLPSGRLDILGAVQGRKTISRGRIVGDYQPLMDVVAGIERVAGPCRFPDRLQRFTTIADAPAAPPQPEITSISPAKAPGGTHERVTITGRNFGTNAVVMFPRGPDAGGVQHARMVSNTDTRIVCEVPVCDSGGVVVRSWDDYSYSDSAPRPFEVSFCHHPVVRVREDLLPFPLTYESGGTPDCENEWEEVTEAFRTWERVPDCYAHTRFWRYSSNIVWPPEPLKPYTGVLLWVESGWSDEEKDVRAFCYFSVDNQFWQHIVFNGQHCQWTDGSSGTGYDVRGVATHEIGHSWGLEDLYGTADKAKTMYGHTTEATARAKRTLHADDIAGIQYIYPGKPGLSVPAKVELTYEAGSDPWGGSGYTGRESKTFGIANAGGGTLSTRLRVRKSSADHVWVSPEWASGNSQQATVLISREQKTVLSSPIRGEIEVSGPLGTSNSPARVPVILTITGLAPRLLWDEGASDGVDPDIGKAMAQEFDFVVVHRDPDKHAPRRIEAVLEYFDPHKGWKSFRRLTMGPNPARYGAKRRYWVRTVLPNRTFRHRFKGVSVDWHGLGGGPTKWQKGPLIIGPPRLYWQGGTGFVADGITPNKGPAGTRFVFKTIYQDAAGDSPTVAQLVIRRNGKVVFRKGMLPLNDEPYRKGRTFGTGVRFSRAGVYEYRFRFADKDGAARGTPTEWQRGPRVLAGADGDGVVAITGVSASATAVAAQVTLTLSQAATVAVRVLNTAGRPVATVCRAQECEAGATTLTWNVQSDSGPPVPGGTYLVEVVARTEGGSQARALVPVSLRR